MLCCAFHCYLAHNCKETHEYGPAGFSLPSLTVSDDLHRGIQPRQLAGHLQHSLLAEDAHMQIMRLDDMLFCFHVYELIEPQKMRSYKHERRRPRSGGTHAVDGLHSEHLGCLHQLWAHGALKSSA